MTKSFAVAPANPSPSEGQTPSSGFSYPYEEPLIESSWKRLGDVTFAVSIFVTSLAFWVWLAILMMKNLGF